MRTWEDKDGSGNKLTDGRLCLVIKSDENPDMPEIRVYGKDKEEILDKIAKTVETGQGQIHRMRSTPPSSPARAAASASQPTDIAIAVADLTNPLKAPAAIKTLLKAGGVDVDAAAIREAGRKVADVCEAWERQHPDFPHDPRNQRMLIDRAIILAGGQYLRVTAKELDAAFQALTSQEMFFEPKPAQASEGSTVQPSGNSDSRTVRSATSYRRNALSSPEPGPSNNENAKEKRWRDILENGTGKALENAMRNEPGFNEWVDKKYAKTA